MIVWGLLATLFTVAVEAPSPGIEMKRWCTVGTEVHCIYDSKQECNDSKTQYESCAENLEGK